VFSRLSFTRDVKPGGYWQGPIRRSLLRLADEDGAYLESLLYELQRHPRAFPVDEDQFAQAQKRRIQRLDGSVVVSIPDDKLSDSN
jgi:hypothetical protein